MKLVALEFGQSFQTVLMEELRPPQGIHMPTFLAAIAHRYRFGTAPTLEQANQGSAKFTEGVITLDGRALAIKDLNIYRDGVIVNAWNTDDADRILTDFMQWATSEFQLRPPLSLPPRRYGSNVIVELSHDLDRMLTVFSKFIEIYRAMLRETTKIEIPRLSAIRLTIGGDPLSLPPHLQTNFIIDRRADVPFSSNRYYAGAPLTTSQHLKMLEAFESTLASQ